MIQNSMKKFFLALLVQTEFISWSIDGVGGIWEMCMWGAMHVVALKVLKYVILEVSEEYSIKKLRRMSFYCFYPLGACHIIFCTFFIVFGYVLHCQVQIEVWHFETTYFIGVTAKNDTFNENKPTMWDFLTVTLLLVWHWEQMLITLEQNWIRKNLRPSRAFPIWLNWTCNSVLKMVFYNWNCSFVALLPPTHMLTGAY